MPTPPISSDSQGDADRIDVEHSLARQRLVPNLDFAEDVTSGRAATLVASRIGYFPGEEKQSFRSGRATLLNRSRGVFVLGATALLMIVGAVGLHVARTSLASTRQYRTASGERSIVQLADGSTILLAPATSVTVSHTSVNVVGEAQFTVAAHSSRPFVVQTRNSLVQVLGTTFVVRQYSDEPETRVAVDAGKVAVHVRRDNASTNNRQTVLSSHTLAQVSDSGVSVTNMVTPSPYTVWTRGMLVFDRAVLRDVIPELRRAYGVDIRIADSTLATQSVGLEIPVAELPIANVLAMIGVATGSHVTFNGTTYVIHPGLSSGKHLDPRQVQHTSQPERRYGR